MFPAFTAWLYGPIGAGAALVCMISFCMPKDKRFVIHRLDYLCEMSILVIDNYDSFTFNLVHMMQMHSRQDIVVKRNDELSLHEVASYDSIVLSPGPGLPSEAGLMMDVIRRYHQKKNILGVCLGLQGIVEFYGGRLKNLEEVLHGRAMETLVTDENDLLFKNVPLSFPAGRYHSWVAERESLPEELIITATDEQGEVMAIRHRENKVRGLQFHPESILTPAGGTILKNWLEG